ncbi:MAG: DUF2304 family protein [Candidatus Dojkabacteria bacterium]
MTGEILAYQLIIIILCAFLILRSIILFLRQKKGIREVILAIVIWGSFSLISLFPVLLQDFAHVLGFELGVNALLVVSTIIIFFILLRTLLRMDKMQNDITKLVRELALKEVKKKD